MLIIRRRAGEGLLMGPGIELDVLEITPSRVTLGVRAPREVPIVRREVIETAEANQAAARVSSEGGLESWAARLRTLRGALKTTEAP